jgi:hypothetical protein
MHPIPLRNISIDSLLLSLYIKIALEMELTYLINY